MQSSGENAPRERMLTPTPLSCPRMRGIQYSRDGGYLSRRRGVLDRPVPSTPRFRRGRGLKGAPELSEGGKPAMTPN